MNNSRIEKIAPLLAFAAVLTAGAPQGAAAQTPAPSADQFRKILKEMVETDSSVISGSCTAVADKIAAHMKANGFPVENITLLAPAEQPKAGNIVAVLPGRDPKLKAVLMSGHIDVVNAKREDWVRNPYELIEEGGYYYGRGVADMKGQAATYIDAMLRYNTEKYKPLRTIKMALSCGEEGGGFINGARWLTQNHKDLVDAGIGFNEGGYGELDEKGNRIVNSIQGAQKISSSFILEATNVGGHSSRPRPDNAIYSLARGLDRISQHDFPVHFIDANRAYFTSMAKIVGGESGAAMTALVANPQDKAATAILDRDPTWHTMLRTTCVATMLEGGHATNALPQRARATINCRVVPGEAPEDVRAALISWVNDPELKVIGSERPGGARPPPSPLTDKIMNPIRKVSEQVWPGVPVVINMAPGGTDAAAYDAVNIPTYGMSGLFRDPDANGAHGLNERMRVRSLMDAREFMYRLIKTFADQRD
jgi:acetylornithine deacetylase/succinyl-diaminopimelate desuccinylase-like protein